MDEMAPVMDIRQEEKEVRAGLRRRYLRQRLAPIDTSPRAPRRDLTVVTAGRDLRRQEDADEVEDDSDDEEAAAARQGTKNRQGKDSDSDDDDDEEYRQNQPVATLAVPEPETPSPTVESFPPPQLVPPTSTTLMAPATPTTPATPPTPTFRPLPPPPPPVITLPPTTVVMTSTVMATPKPSAVAPPVVNNPQVNSPSPTSTSISLMTTQPITLVSSISVSSQPRKGVGNPETTSSPTVSPTSTQTTQTTPFAFEKSTPSATPSLEDVMNGNGNSNGNSRDQDRGPPRGLDPAAEHALISAGSIGKFEARIATSEHPRTDPRVIRWFYHCLLHLLDGMAHGQEVESQGEWLLRKPATTVEPAPRQDSVLWTRPARLAGDGRWPQ